MLFFEAEIIILVVDKVLELECDHFGPQNVDIGVVQRVVCGSMSLFIIS